MFRFTGRQLSAGVSDSVTAGELWGESNPLKSQPEGMVCGLGNGSKIGVWADSWYFLLGVFMIYSPGCQVTVAFA